MARDRECWWRGMWISSIDNHSGVAAASAKAAMVDERAEEVERYD